MRDLARTRLARTLPAAAIVVTLTLVIPGCGGTTVYDGSNSFYDQHPQYRDEPTYMHSADDVDVNSNRPF